MASPKQSGTLMVLQSLLDQFNKRSHLTLLFTGVQGIGKSEAIFSASEKMNGEFASDNCATIDGSTTFEGDLSGNPHLIPTGKSTINVENFVKEYKEALSFLDTVELSKEEKESAISALASSLLESNTIELKELTYAKHPVIARISKLQEYYYNQLKTTGFRVNDGIYKLDENLNEIIINDKTNEVTLIKKYNYSRHYSDSFKNQYEFGENLTPEDRIYLLLSQQVRPFFVLVDELNRPDQRTMSEMMNLTLNRQINGYHIPWFVSIAAAQNPAGMDSDYATTDLEPAQLDRFCSIKMNSNIDDWVIHALNEGIQEEYVYSVYNNGEQCFSPDDLVQRSEPNVKPSPRSNSIVGKIIKNFDYVMSLPCFTDQERQDKEFYLSTLLNGILGQDATNIILLSMQDKENMITVPEILTGTDKHLSEKAKRLIKNKTTIAQTMLMTSLIHWLCENWTQINAKKSSNKPEDQVEYVNYNNQLGELMDYVQPAVMNYFCNQINTAKYDIRLADGSLKPNSSLLSYIFDFLNYNKKVLEAYRSVNTMASKI